MGPITTQPFRKLPVAAKLGKPGHQFDDAGARARIALVVVVVVVVEGYHSENDRASPGITADRRLCFLLLQAQSSATVKKC